VTITRFAPSPTGWLHLGHAYAARFAHDAAGPAGRFLVRIEDLEPERVRPEYEVGIFEDLRWLGLDCAPGIWLQSARAPAYRDALARLIDQGDAYPCFCSRSEVAREVARMGGAPQGDLGPAYPGRCRTRPAEERRTLSSDGAPHVWRLDLDRIARRHGPLRWHDARAGEGALDPAIGDPVIARRDGAAAYHLAVVVDDAAQGVTLVTRGEDLLTATGIHRALQAALGLPTPGYHHHGLVLDGEGRRLAKRADSFALRRLREAGWTPPDVWRAIESNLSRR